MRSGSYKTHKLCLLYSELHAKIDQIHNMVGRIAYNRKNTANLNIYREQNSFMN